MEKALIFVGLVFLTILILTVAIAIMEVMGVSW